MSQKKYVVGIVINSIGNPFFSRVRQGFEDSRKKWENFGLEMYYKEIRGYNEEEQIEAIDDVAAPRRLWPQTKCDRQPAS